MEKIFLFSSKEMQGQAIRNMQQYAVGSRLCLRHNMQLCVIRVHGQAHGVERHVLPSKRR